MTTSASHSAQRVQEALEGLGVSLQVEILPASTRSAQEAAQAIGCKQGQIAKSLIFQTVTNGRPLLVIASGANRVDEQVIADQVGEPIHKADADFVRRVTGFAIGGVPPVGHVQEIETYLDEDLLSYKYIWAAAGTPHAVFKLTGDILVQVTGGTVIRLAA